MSATVLTWSWRLCCGNVSFQPVRVLCVLTRITRPAHMPEERYIVNAILTALLLEKRVFDVC